MKKANVISGIISRTFTYLDEKTFVRLFTSLVRPHLEYAAVVWNPHWRKDVIRLETVQRRATKQVPGLKDLPNSERLERLGLPTLEFRRFRGVLREAFKIFNVYDIEPKDFLNLPSSSTLSRGNSPKNYKPNIRTSIRASTVSPLESLNTGMIYPMKLCVPHRSIR